MSLLVVLARYLGREVVSSVDCIIYSTSYLASLDNFYLPFDYLV
jgi:hypothetical protein